MLRTIASSLACLLLSSFQLYAQEAGQRLVLRSESFQETYRSEVPVSGGVRAGVIAGALDAPVDPAGLSVFLPATAKGTLCVTITSRDGRYVASMKVSLDGAEAGQRQISFPTRYNEDIARYTARELAVLAHVVEAGCEVRPSQVLATSWSSHSSILPLTILVNSGRTKTTLFVPLGSGGFRKTKCNQLKTTNLVAYDTECQLTELSDVKGEIEIRRSRFMNNLPPVMLPIKLN